MDAPNHYRATVEEHLELANNLLIDSIPDIDDLTFPDMKLIVGTYQAAFERNYIQWLRRAHEKVKSEKATAAILTNINYEISQGRSNLLKRFVKSCGVDIEQIHTLKAKEASSSIWNTFAYKDNITNLAVAATLEHTSPVYIKYLEEIGEALHCENFDYIRSYRVPETIHFGDLENALVEEMMHGTNPERSLAHGIGSTTDFLKNVFTVQSER